jgi:hypothetical protein
MKYLIAISLLISHTATAQLSGRYVTNEKLMMHGQIEIVLSSDGTYKSYDPGIGSRTSTTVEGRYTLSADTIFLAGEFDEGPPRQRRVSIVDTLIYRKRHITSLSGWKYYKQKPRRELNDLLR